MAASWTLTLKNLCLPIFCFGCGLRLLTDENGFFCPTCWEMGRRIERPLCTTCGAPHQGVVGFDTIHNYPCADCRQRGPRAFRRVYGAAYYEEAVAHAIRLLKFDGKERLARPLAEEAAVFARREMECDTYEDVVPVPLHRVRQRDRGFNQAVLLARELLPVFPNARLNESLRRIRPTRIQSKLANDKERAANVVGAFAVERDRDFEGRTVLVVDDVVTTRSTVEECAAALKRAGAAQVDVLAVALPVGGAAARRPGEDSGSGGPWVL